MEKGVGVFIPEKEEFSEEEILSSVFRAKKIEEIDGTEYVILTSEAGDMILPLKGMVEEFVGMFKGLSSQDIDKLKKAINKALHTI